MKITHLSTYDCGGGAFIAATRLHMALLESDVDSIFRCAISSSGLPNILAPKSKPRTALAYLRSSASWQISKLQRTFNPITHSTSCLPSYFHHDLNRSNSDILNLHWVQDEFISSKAIGLLRKPIVWTLHDSWPFCGSEHHPRTLEDERFIHGYTKNNRWHQDSGYDLDRHTWNRKKKEWQYILEKLYCVAPSSWMADQVKKSALFRDVRCSIIPNPVPTAFSPRDPGLARDLFDLPQDKALILVSNLANGADSNKGLQDLVPICQILSHHSLLPIIVSLGSHAPPSSIAGIQTISIPRLTDALTLSLLYSAVDLVLIPSRIENLPQFATESLSCGTPVVAYRQGGMSDAVQHMQNGYLAHPYSIADLTHGITTILSLKKSSLDPSLDPIVRSWRPDQISRLYLDLYRSVLSS